MRIRKQLVFLILTLCLSYGAVFGSSYETDAVYAGKLESKLMGREMPYNVYGPLGYSKKGTTRYPVVFLLHGLTGNYSNWIQQGKIGDVVKEHGVIIVTPEGNNGWYTDSPVKENDKYESYIIDELIPEIERNFPVRTDRDGRAIAGLSMGGYGGLKFGIKYPEKFVIAGSFSGALRAAEWDDKTVPAWRVLGDSVMSAFGPNGSLVREKNDLFKMTAGISKEETKKLPFLYLDCGTEDGLIGQNSEFAALLIKQGIAHEFRQLPGRHDWRFWRVQIGEFLELSDRFLKPVAATAAGQ